VPDDWAAVAHAIDGRMTELGLSQRELVKRSHVSLAIVQEIRHHTVERRRSLRTLESLSTALDWPPDYLHSVLSGREPTTATGPAGDSAASLSSRMEALEAQMSEVIELLSTVKSGVETLIEHAQTDR
jgi:transcriptional regulator with XRE-family HTH domain